MHFSRKFFKSALLICFFIFLLAATAFASGDRYALVIGIGDYQDPAINDLKFAGADAQAVAAYLTDPKMGGVPKSNLFLLVNEQATTIKIREALTVIHDKTSSADTVFVYFAGHGAPEKDRFISHTDGFTKYIVTQDARRDNLYATAISMDEIEGNFASMDAACLVFVMDSCYSGATGGRTFTDFKGGARDLGISQVFSQNIEQGEGRGILTASKATEVAMEYPEKGHGLFTYYFLEAVMGLGDGNKDGQVTLQEAYDYVQQHVIPVSKALGGRQHPQLRTEIAKGEIVLASVDGIKSIQRKSDVVVVRTGKYSAAKWSSLVVTGVAGGAATAFYLTGNNYYASWQDAEDPSEKNRLKQDTEDYYLYGQISAGIAGAAAVCTVTFFVLDAVNNKKGKSASRLRFYSSVDPDSGAPMLGLTGIIR